MNNPIVKLWYWIFPVKDEQAKELDELLDNKNSIINSLLNNHHKKLSTVKTLKLLAMVEEELEVILKDRFFDAHEEIAAIETYRNKKNGKEDIKANS